MKCERYTGNVVRSYDAFFDLVYLRSKQRCQKSISVSWKLYRLLALTPGGQGPLHYRNILILVFTLFCISGSGSWLDPNRQQLRQVSGLPQEDQNVGGETMCVVSRDGEDGV